MRFLTFAFLAPLALVAFLLTTNRPAAAAPVQEPIYIHVFGSTDCPLCGQALAYLRSVADRRGAVVLWHATKGDRHQTNLMNRVGRELGVRVSGYPFIIVGRRSHLGWSAETTGLVIVRELDQVRATGEEDLVTRSEKEMAAEEAVSHADGHSTTRFRLGPAVGVGLLALSLILMAASVASKRKKL